MTDGDLPLMVTASTSGGRKRKKRKVPSSNTGTSNEKKTKEHQEKQLIPDQVPFQDQEYVSEEIIELPKEAEVEAYKRHICQDRLVVSISADNNAFVLPGFAKDRLTDDIYIVERRIMLSVSKESAMWYCSCNPYRTRLVKMLNKVDDSSALKFDDNNDECSHIIVCKAFAPAPEPDQDHKYSQDTDTAILIPWNPRIIVLALGTQFTILKVDYNPRAKLQCTFYGCKEEKYDCHHKVKLQALLLEDEYLSNALEVAYSEKVRVEGRYIPKTFSDQPILLYPSIPAPCPPPKQLVFSLDCSNCREYANPSRREAVIVSSRYAEITTVQQNICGNCGHMQHFDGATVGLLNMGDFVIAHELFQSYLRQYVFEGTTLAGYFKELCWIHLDNPEFQQHMSYYRLQHSWNAFVDLLDIPYTEAFVCPSCGPQPNIVVMDGVTLSLRKSFIPLMVSKKEPKSLDGSLQKMVYLLSKKGRVLLQKFGKNESLGHEDFDELKATAQSYQPSLVPLLTYLESSSNLTCPSWLKKFILCLSSAFPVSSYFCPTKEMGAVLAAVKDDKELDANLVLFLERHSPILGFILTSHPEMNGVLAPIMEELLKKSKKESHKSHKLKLCGSECDCGKEALSFFPSLQKIYHRGTYVSDRVVKKDDEGCTKSAKGHPILAPGLFTLSCTHGVCYGYQILDVCEGPNIPFTLLRTRFPTAPQVVVYDNACNLHYYCLIRDPGFFRETRFLVDRLHWKNHTGCPEAYNISLYSQYSNINSQAAEQRNSLLVKLKSMLSYTNLDNFHRHLKLYMYFHNMLAMARSNFNADIKYMDFFKRLYLSTKRVK